MRHIVVGGGVIGEVIIAARVAAGDDVVLVETNPDRAQQVANKYSIQQSSLAQALDTSAETAILTDAANESTTVWLAVKPQQMPEVLPELSALAATLNQQPLVISLAAGLTTDQLIKMAPKLARLVRVMPNTPARIGRGITAIANPPLSPNLAGVSRADLKTVGELLTPLGAAVEVPESLIDAVTVVAGSGPAYLFYLAESMTQAGVSLGLEPSLSKQLVGETLAGASELLRASPLDAEQLRAEVTSRAGVTFAATTYMDEHRVKDQIIAAIDAAYRRAKELGEESTKT
jgi:pyrroline-5-carboxylate reductase